MFALEVGVSVFDAVGGEDGFLDGLVDWLLDDWWDRDTGNAFFMGVELETFVTLDTLSVVVESLTVTVTLAIFSAAGHRSGAAYTIDWRSVAWVT